MTKQNQAAAPAKKSMEAQEIIFEDEESRIAWEIGQAIDQLVSEFPPRYPSAKASRDFICEGL